MLAVRPTRKFPALQKLVRHIAQGVPVAGGPAWVRRATYESMRAVFLRNAGGSPFGRPVRERVLAAFERVHEDLGAAHSPTDMLFVAEALLSLDCPGVIVECGCYQGASTAKLSVLARETGRLLHVFDSFEGLPASAPEARRDFHVRAGSRPEWTPGRYAASLETVKSNVATFGDLSVCTFHPGWFRDTLTGSAPSAPVALAITDVDIAASARDCLLGLWPKLADGGAFFSHDIAFLGVLDVLADERLWRETLKAPRPIIFGAGYGLCDASPMLGYLVKADGLEAGYLTRFTFDKVPPPNP